MNGQLLNNLRIQKEIVLCENDPIYFMANYVSCYHSTHGVIPFQPHPHQERYIKELVVDDGNVIVDAERAVGSTISTTITCLWYGFFQKKSITFTAHNRGHGTANLQVLRESYYSLPLWLRDANPIVVDNKDRIELANGSRFYVMSASRDAFRGHRIDVAFIDTFQLIKRQDDAQEIIHTLRPNNTKIILVAPGGRGSDLFYDMYTDAVTNRNSFKAIRLTADD